ncbi:MAG TPA: enoyl-CoA hydratase-related protein [Nevskiaceae bacterium]|nr:enoyl-CoA hydratase-related protein [Nevskiaceae bacterium]
MAENVLYVLEDGVATLALNRPESLNSLDLPTVEALLAGAGRAVAERAAVLVLTGRGRAFSSGADLSAALDMVGADRQVDLGRAMRSHYNRLVQTLADLEIPVVAAVNGLAVGGGMSLALCGDIVIAARSASFRQVFVDIGLIPDMGATWMVPRLVGRARARGMALLGGAFSAEQARDWGLIWDVVDDAELLPAAARVAQRLAGKSRQTLRGVRLALDAAVDNTLEEQLAYEAREQTKFGRLPAFAAAVTKFLGRGRRRGS